MTDSTYINKATYEYLISKYQKVALSKEELANELGISKYTIDSYISKGYGIPEYTKIGNTRNGKVLFPLISVAKFLSNTIKVAA